MKNLILVAAAILMSVAANAQRDCTYNLERNTFNGFSFVQSFTRFGFDSCADAYDACEDERFNRSRYWNFRCERDFSAPRVKTCEFRIQTRRGFQAGRFSYTGTRPCPEARRRCQQELDYQRRWGRVGRAAECVRTSGRNPAPRPGRLVTRTCSVELLAGRVGRPTGNVYTGTGTARNGEEARQRACADARTQCNAVARGTMRCEVIRQTLPRKRIILLRPGLVPGFFVLSN